MEIKPLKIFSASAGSGKTYTLVRTYLSLILGQDTSAISKIMAMTFTNKAALEMKSRIIQSLDDLSNPSRRGKNERQIQNALKYQDEIADFLKMPKEKIQLESRKALHTILHQYEDFYVMTIDKFNLRLIRSFALDLDLDTNFRVVINEDEIIQHVIDDLLDEIDPEFSSILSKMFFNLSIDRVNDGKSWNFEGELYKYAQILRNENASRLINHTDDELLSKEKFKSIKMEIALIRNQIEDLSREFLAYFEPVVDEFKTLDGKKISGQSVNPFIKRLSNINVLSIDTCKKLFSGKILDLIVSCDLMDPVGSVLISFHDNFMSKLIQLEEYLKIKESYYYLVLLKEIQQRLDIFRSQEQIIRISEFNKMISELLRNENSPFIYEKLGTRFEHFLLDEFQDTSRLQWLNVVPLIHESISNNHENLIVGDPKQAIYRFRDGLAEQFVALPQIYNPEKDTVIERLSNYFNKMGEKKSLSFNYRSNYDIVDFNNRFFSLLVPFILQNKELDFSDYYRDIIQDIHRKDRGYIHVVSQILSKEEKEENSELEINYLLEKVKECIDDGYEKGEICVLGSKKTWCNDYALALTKAGYSVVSVDSLAVNSDQSVQLCLLYLSWRNQPTNELLAKRFITKFFFLKHPDSATEKYISYFEVKEIMVADETKEITYFNFNRFISEYFNSSDRFFFPFENLYTLLQQFYLIAGLSELHNPYLHQLSDLAFEYDMNNGPDLNSFIEYYELNGKNTSIQTPENKDAIKIMTSHKSKGLEFKVVILPQINEEFMKSGADNKHLIQLENNLAYTNLSNNVVSEQLKKEYKEEYRASLLDKLNLNYVAFTRAKERLYIMNKLTDRTKSDNYLGTIIHHFLSSEMSEGKVSEQIKDEKGTVLRTEMEFGERIKKLKSEEEESITGFVPMDLSDYLWFPSISLRRHLIEQEEGISEQVRYGKQLHLLLSEYLKYNKSDDIIEIFSKKGLIEKQFESRLKEDLARITSNSKFTELHQNALKIINEQSIIVSESEILRPDKIIIKKDEVVVLDFKTGLPSEKHIKQVTSYCDALSEAGYDNVSGYLLYTKEMRFIAV